MVERRQLGLRHPALRGRKEVTNCARKAAKENAEARIDGVDPGLCVLSNFLSLSVD
jgi:hypothetical protein